MGDASTGGGISHGTNGNVVGIDGTGTLDIATVLEPLADNGGSTPTHTLAPGSPAIDTGDPNFDPDGFDPALSTDQRGSGFPRVLRATAAAATARIDIGAVEVAAPVIEVTGNDEVIASGSTDTSDVDNTDFGIVDRTGSGESRTFVIRNVGDGPLSLTGSFVTITGSDAFTVGGAPDGEIAPSGSTSLSIHFLPENAGLHTATVTITSSDPATPSYTFAISGEGLNRPPVVVDNGIPDQSVIIGDPALTVDLTGYFSDADDDSLSYAIEENLNPGIATASINGAELSLSGVSVGTATISIRVSDGQGGSVVDTLLVRSGTANPTIAVTSGLKLNRQSGLFEFGIEITNTTNAPAAGLRVTVTNLPPNVLLWNNTGPAGSNANYIDIIFEVDAPLDIDAFINLVLEIYSPTRTLPSGWQPAITVDVLQNQTQPTGDGLGTPVVKIVEMSDGAMLIEFEAVIGQWYEIEYSDDGMSTWRRVLSPVLAGANRLQWIDNGPPKTLVHPSELNSRFYRVKELTSP